MLVLSLLFSLSLFQHNIFIDYVEILTMHPIHPSHPPTKEKVHQVQFVLPMYSLEHDGTPRVQSLKENCVLPAHPARSHKL